MTPVEGLGQAVAAVAAGLRQDRDALNILLRMSPDETVAVAAGMLDLVRLLAQIVAEREDASAAAAFPRLRSIIPLPISAGTLARSIESTEL